jgi:NAD(P)H-hydrate epimerase
MRILNAAQMREADRFTIEEIGIPSPVLMENAGRQVVGARGGAEESEGGGGGARLWGGGDKPGHG